MPLAGTVARLTKGGIKLYRMLRDFLRRRRTEKERENQPEQETEQLSVPEELPTPRPNLGSPHEREQEEETSATDETQPSAKTLAELDRMVDTAVENPNFSAVRTEPGSDVNLIFPQHWDPLPYKAGTKTTTVRLKEVSDGEFVRVHGAKNPNNQWIMRKEDLLDEKGRRLSPEALRRKFMLPATPSEISDVVIPAGTEIRIGIVAPRPGEPGGNVVQYDLMKKPPRDWFRNRRPLNR